MMCIVSTPQVSMLPSSLLQGHGFVRPQSLSELIIVHFIVIKQKTRAASFVYLSSMLPIPLVSNFLNLFPSFTSTSVHLDLQFYLERGSVVVKSVNVMPEHLTNLPYSSTTLVGSSLSVEAFQCLSAHIGLIPI